MFQRYKRCPWEIEGKPEDDEDGAPLSFYLLLPPAHSCTTESPPRMDFYKPVSSHRYKPNPDSLKRPAGQFEQISRFLSPREPPPSMVLDRTVYEDGLTLPNAETRELASVLIFVGGVFF
jgi:hypothetical protein